MPTIQLLVQVQLLVARMLELLWCRMKFELMMALTLMAQF